MQDGASSTTATQSMTSSGGTGLQAAQGSPQATTVRRIIKVNLDDLDEQMDEPEVTMLRMVQVGETYDLTYSDSDDDWFVCDSCECGGNAYFMDYASNSMNAAMELYGTGGLRPLDGEEAYIRGVMLENNIPVVLDSGAGMSVLPMKFKNVGLALSKKSVLRVAQGTRMAVGAIRQAIVELVDDEGNKACIKETFALSNAAEPLLALGKMLKKGWTVAGQDGS